MGTIEYTVDTNDTIERIALKWNTIPSDILHLNRLSTRMLFPGQVLYVPDPNYVPKSPILAKSPTLSPTNKASPQLVFDRLSHIKMRHNSATKPGHIERSNTIAYSGVNNNKSEKFDDVFSSTYDSKQHLRHTLSEDEAKRLDEECMQRFLKLESKQILQDYKGTIVDGVLLITPSALMFDPRTVTSKTHDANDRRKSSASSPSSSDNDSIIIPIEIISNVVLYEDLSIRDVHNYIQKKRFNY